MTDFGITETGFTLKRLADIKADFITALSTVEDPVSGEKLTPDLNDEDDPIVQILNAFADSLAVAWENLQLAYNQFDPLKATNHGLSGVVQLNGIQRAPGVPATISLELTGTEGTVLAAGRQVTTESNFPIFELPATILGAGTTTVTATCTVDGVVEANPYTVTKILTPVSGWTTVTNPLVPSVGVDEESDSALRVRQQYSTSYPAQTIIEAIYAAVSNIDGVTFATLYQNITLATDGRGIPAKSIAPVILGGDDDEIAQAIFEKLASGGADSYGTTTVTIYDTLGTGYDINFTRPTETPIYVEIDFTIVNPSVWPTDGEDNIKSAIIAWATEGATGVGIGADTDYDQNGYTPGQSVYASEIVVPCYSIPGIKINSVYVDTVSPAVSSEVTIAWNEIAQFTTTNINLTET